MNDIKEAPPPPKPPEDRTFMSMIRAANKRPPLKTIEMRVPIAKLSLSNIAAVAANLPSYNFGTFSSEVIAEAASMFIPGGAGKLAKAGLALARAGIKLISLADTAGSVEDFLKEYHFVSESGDRTPREEIRAESSGTFQMAGGILEKIREVKTFNDILRTAHRKEMEANIDWYKVSPRERAITHQRRLAEEKAEREKREEEALAKFRLTPLERAIAHHKKLDEEKLAKQEKAKTEAAEAKKYSGENSCGGSSTQPPEGDGKEPKKDNENRDNDRRNRGEEWKNKIYGKPQKTGTPGHDWQSARDGIEKAKDSNVAEVHFDRPLDKITSGKVDSKMRPDVTSVRKDGKIVTDEIPSKSQSVEQMQKKIEKMQNLLPEELQGGGKVYSIKK
jgi:hypothetical protein